MRYEIRFNDGFGDAASIIVTGETFDEVKQKAYSEVIRQGGTTESARFEALAEYPVGVPILGEGEL